MLRKGKDIGQLYFENGEIIDASINNRSSNNPEITALSVLTWKDVEYRFTPMVSHIISQEIHEGTQALLLQAAKMADEI